MISSRRRRKTLLALTSLSLSNFYQTGLGGGEAGSNSGFGILWLIYPRAATATYQGPGARRSGGGWQALLAPTPALDVLGYLFDSPSTWVAPTFKFPPSRFHRLMLLWLQFTGTQARVMIDRLDSLYSAPLASYAPATAGREFLGINDGIQYASTDIDVLARLAWRGTPTDAHLIELADMIRMRGDLPRPSEWTRATITHRTSLRDQLSASGVQALDGQAAPATIADTATLAPLDEVTQLGAVKLRRVSVGADGRKNYGAQGFSATNFLATANGAGIRGIGSGFTVRLIVTFWTIAAGDRYVANCTNTQGSNGWAWYRSGATLAATVGPGGGARASTRTLKAEELGAPHLLHLIMDATGAVTLCFDAIPSAPSAGGAWAAAAASIPMLIGVLSTTANFPAFNESVSFLDGANYIASPSDVAADYLAWRSTGTLPSIAAKPSPHAYDLTQGILANGGPDEGIPAVVVDGHGTDHLASTGGIKVRTTGVISGLTGLNLGQVLASSPLSSAFTASQWWFALDVLLGDWGIDALTHYLLSKANIATHGVEFRIIDRNLQLTLGTGSARGLQANMVLAGTDFTQRTRILAQFDGPSGVASFYFGSSARSASGPGGAVYAAYPGPLVIGAAFYTGSNSNPLCTYYGVQVGTGIPTSGERDTLLADTSFAAIAGKTTQRLWFPSDIAESGGKPPAVAKERTVGVDHVAATGAPLQVAQRSDRAWSFDAQPIAYGASGLSTSDYYASAVNSLPGDDIGFVVSLLFVVTAQSAGGVKSVFNQCENGIAQGWEMWLNGTNTTIGLGIGNGTGNTNAPTGVIAATDVGKILLATAVHDRIASKVRMYFKRSEVGTGTNMTSAYVPRTSVAAAIGRRHAAAGAPNCVVLGAYYARGIPTLAQVQAQHDAVMATERMQICPGVPGTIIDVTADVQANSFALPATLTDRGGPNVHFARVGTPALAPHHSRAFGW